MAGRRALGFQTSNVLAMPKTTASTNLKDQAKRAILRNVRSQGHTYVELREDGKKSIFFCTLCLAQCYGDSALFDHLKGNLHNERLRTAKVTLLGRNPWPFNDGVVFFSKTTESGEDTRTPDRNESRFLECDNGNNLSIVTYNGNSEVCASKDLQVDRLRHQNEDLDSVGAESDVNFSSSEERCAALIPGIRVRGEITNVEVREVGYGLISARFYEKDGLCDGICRIWCEWLGKKTNENEDFVTIPEHDFAIVTFSYNDCNLGRMGRLDDLKSLLCSSPETESQDDEDTSKKRRKSLSDPGDVSENSNNRYDSGGEDSSASAVSSLMLNQYDDQLLDARFISSKALRRELRRKQRIAAERMCDICKHKMLPGRDVATLMNVKNGKLACSSRNGNGAFHLFHTSCLIHWVLLCELETISNQPEAPKVKRRSRRKTASRANEGQKDTEMKALSMPINCVICPECQGTGKVVDGDDEKPSVPLSKMFKYKIKVSDARRAWMKSPEVLENCSTGFHFPSQSDEKLKEKVKPLKLLRFYGAC